MQHDDDGDNKKNDDDDDHHHHHHHHHGSALGFDDVMATMTMTVMLTKTYDRRRPTTDD